MLIQMIRTYRAKPEQIEALQLAVVDLRNRVMGRYLGSRKYALYIDPGRQEVTLSGILLHRTAAEDMQATDDPDVARVRSRVSELSVGLPTTELREVAFSQDDEYCEHTHWEDLVLVTEPFLGHSPLQCNLCGGWVAPYRLRLQEETAEQLHTWNRQYDCIDDLWMQSADYESWADKELTSPQSSLNRLGMDLRRRITEDLRCQVWYYLPLGEEKPADSCRNCGQKTYRSSGKEWNIGCSKCWIVLAKS